VSLAKPVTLFSLTNALQSIFGPSATSFLVKYKDADDDLVTIGSQHELDLAVNHPTAAELKIWVTVRTGVPASAESAEKSAKSEQSSSAEEAATGVLDGWYRRLKHYAEATGAIFDPAVQQFFYSWQSAPKAEKAPIADPVRVSEESFAQKTIDTVEPFISDALGAISTAASTLYAVVAPIEVSPPAATSSSAPSTSAVVAPAAAVVPATQKTIDTVEPYVSDAMGVAVTAAQWSLDKSAPVISGVAQGVRVMQPVAEDILAHVLLAVEPTTAKLVQFFKQFLASDYAIFPEHVSSPAAVVVDAKVLEKPDTLEMAPLAQEKPEKPKEEPKEEPAPEAKKEVSEAPQAAEAKPEDAHN
jgi:hypothetical protein